MLILTLNYVCIQIYYKNIWFILGRDKQQLVAVRKVSPATGKNIGQTVNEVMDELGIKVNILSAFRFFFTVVRVTNSFVTYCTE